MDKKTLAKLIRTHLKAYAPLVLAGPWKLDWEIQDTPFLGDGKSERHIAETSVLPNELRARLLFAGNADWGTGASQDDLEITVVHELLHPAFWASGFDGALQEALNVLKEASPKEARVCEQWLHITMEALIDYLAQSIIRSVKYGKARRTE